MLVLSCGSSYSMGRITFWAMPVIIIILDNVCLFSFRRQYSSQVLWHFVFYCYRENMLLIKIHMFTGFVDKYLFYSEWTCHWNKLCFFLLTTAWNRKGGYSMNSQGLLFYSSPKSYMWVLLEKPPTAPRSILWKKYGKLYLYWSNSPEGHKNPRLVPFLNHKNNLSLWQWYKAESMDREIQVTDPHIFYKVHLWVTLIHYPKYIISLSNSLQDMKQNHWTIKYRSLTYIYLIRSIYATHWSTIPTMMFSHQIILKILSKITRPCYIAHVD